MLTVEKKEIDVPSSVFVLMMGGNYAQLPEAGEVIGLDLTKRTIRVQLAHGKEVVISAEKGSGATYWVFHTAECARMNSIRAIEAQIRRQENRLDEEMKRLENMKSELAHAKSWNAAKE